MKRRGQKIKLVNRNCYLNVIIKQELDCKRYHITKPYLIKKLRKLDIVMARNPYAFEESIMKIKLYKR